MEEQDVVYIRGEHLVAWLTQLPPTLAPRSGLPLTANGDLIVVGAGTYAGPVAITRSVVLAGGRRDLATRPNGQLHLALSSGLRRRCWMTPQTMDIVLDATRRPHMLRGHER